MRGPPRAVSILGLLVALACIVLLMSLMLPALQQAKVTSRSMADSSNLAQIYTAMQAVSTQPRAGLPAPSTAGSSTDITDNTTANFYSLLIAEQAAYPEMLVSANERSARIWPIDNYNFGAINPGAGVYWDPAFTADLETSSNVSFAHMPLFGERFDRHWKRQAMDSNFPVLGNRGPKDGRHDPFSQTNGPDGRWAGGYFVYGDGHAAWVRWILPGDGGTAPDAAPLPAEADNPFAIDDEERHSDAVITFTRRMKESGPVVQHD